MVSPPSVDLLCGLVQDTVILGWERLTASSPVMESVSVLDIFTDQAMVPHCGTLILSRPEALSGDQPFVIIPKPKKGSREEVEPVITIKAENVTRVEYGLMKNLWDRVVCLHLKTGLDNNRIKKSRIFFIMEEHQSKIAIDNVPLLSEEKFKMPKLTSSRKLDKS